MRRRIALALLMLATTPVAAWAQSCNLNLTAELPIRQVAPGQPIFVQASIRGQPIPMLLDTGSAMTTIDRATAEKFGLELRTESHVRAQGLGGDMRVFRVAVPDFALGKQRIRNLTVWSVEGMRSDAKQMRGGLLGEDVLGDFDLEFDIRKGRLALYEKEACAHAPPWSDESMTVPIFGSRTGRIQFDVKLNGQTLKAELDSGASRTVLTWRGANRLGITESSSGLEAAGATFGADGKALVRSFYRFESFELDGEVIRNPRLGIIDIVKQQTRPDQPLLRSQEQPDMLLGADWLRAHHVYVARAAGEMHFSYLGGPVFEK